MPRFAPVMTMDDFKSNLVSAAEVFADQDQKPVNPQTEYDWEGLCILLHSNLPKIQKDWDKVQFDCENMMLEEFATTPDNIPYVRMCCGGDWEWPVHAIIYFDGDNFRGYVPGKGNTYKVKTKTAYGNDDEDNEYDPDAPHKVYPEVDLSALNADIASRIRPRV